MKAITFSCAVCIFLLSTSSSSKDVSNDPKISRTKGVVDLSSPSDLNLPYSGVVSNQGFAFGITNTAPGNTIGIIGSSWGQEGRGIYGIATSNLEDAKNYGGYFSSDGGKGIAVYGVALHTDWVENYGGYFVSNGKYGAGVYGSSAGGHGKGVIGENIENGYIGYLGTRIAAVEGMHKETGTRGALGNKTYGVWGQYGSNGYSAALGTENYAIRANGPLLIHGAGIRVENAGGDPLMTIDGPSGWNTDFWGKVVIRSRPSNRIILELGEGLDYAEGFCISKNEDIFPGTVVVIDPDNPGKLKISEESYDKKVAGIVSAAPGVVLGVDEFEYSIALSGRLYCKVDGTFGKIEPGDLLTTSPNPGYAMVAKDYYRAQGAIIGKAMESLEFDKKGSILVLVSLQ